MRKLIILGFLVLLFTCSFFVAGYYIMFDFPFSGTYTKAVCSSNVCQDYLFTCFDGEIIKKEPISGFVTFGSDWVDLRTEEENKC